ncbi:MAG: dienelactone hydrolase family protein [Candidatus Marinimicrobia bacterium]|nr:dienelactone hydrolase family protein [Candidatus Neomarinimicrobiota bacterium]
MRQLEFFIILSSAVALYYLFIKNDRASFLYSLFGSIAITLIHFFTESSRWQMVPAYFFLVALFIVYKIYKNKPPIIFLVLFTGWLVGSGLLPWFIPIFSLPEPDGQFSVGTETFHWVDSSRQEWFTQEIENDVREIMVQVWHPTAKNNNTNKTPYFDFVQQRARGLTQAGGLPSFFANHLGLIKTNSSPNAQLAKTSTKMPIIIVSHGITGSRHLHSSLNEHFASEGYIVFGVDHSFDANLTIFPDGRIADYRSDLYGNPDSLQIRTQQMKTRTNDVIYILNQIDKMNSGEIKSKYLAKLDLDNIGIIGHSYGGATAINASAIDSRLKACFALDGWINPIPKSIIESGLGIPFYFLGRPSWENSDYPNNYTLLSALLHNGSGEQLFSIVNKTQHLDFTDTPLFSPLASYFLDVGELPASISQPLIFSQAYTFFNHFLKKSSGYYVAPKSRHITIQYR